MGMKDTIQTLGFSEAFPVEGRSSIADLFKPKKRCGVYLLHFTTGEYYCGQAVDVTRRFVQHTKNHPDICEIHFQEILPENLNQVEMHCIHTLEAAGFHLRNISLTSMPYGESDFDLVMEPADQERWLQDYSYRGPEGPRMQDQNLRSKYKRKFQQFIATPRVEEAIPVMQKYARLCLPAIRNTEASFWSCSCLPSFGVPDVQILSRVNIYLQEVFTVVRDLPTNSIHYSFHLAKSPFQTEKRIRAWARRYRIPDHYYDKHQYKPGGQDQTCIIATRPEAALELLDDPTILEAIRLFNLRLMKKGANINGRAHCMDLADLMIEHSH